MRTLGFIFALIVMLAGVSVQAQEGFQPRISPPTPEPTKIVLQDDNGGGYLVFDPTSGSYDCKLCEYGYVFLCSRFALMLCERRSQTRRRVFAREEKAFSSASICSERPEEEQRAPVM